MSKITFGAAAAIFTATLMACAYSGAARAEATRTQTVVVDHNDLDLSTPAGLATFKRRVEQAARNACGPVAKFPAPAFESYEACHQAALASAAAAVEMAVTESRNKHQFAAAPSN